MTHSFLKYNSQSIPKFHDRFDFNAITWHTDNKDGQNDKGTDTCKEMGTHCPPKMQFFGLGPVK